MTPSKKVLSAVTLSAVMPGEDGLNRVIVRDIERDNAEEEAVDAATDFCKEKKQMPVFSKNNKTEYTGNMDEATRNTVRNASKAAVILGGTGVGVSSRTRTAGGIIGSAGTVGRVMTNDRDYKVELEFKCQ